MCLWLSPNHQHSATVLFAQAHAGGAARDQSKAWPWRSRRGHPPSTAGGCSHREGDSTDPNFICPHKQRPAQTIGNHLSRVRTSARDTPQLTHHCRAGQPPTTCLRQEEQGREGKRMQSAGPFAAWQDGQLQQEHRGREPTRDQPGTSLPSQLGSRSSLGGFNGAQGVKLQFGARPAKSLFSHLFEESGR